MRTILILIGFNLVFLPILYASYNSLEPILMINGILLGSILIANALN